MGEVAYLAGIVDADGCISVRRSTYAARRGLSGGAAFWERIVVKQVSPEAIVLLYATFGGSRRLHPPTAERGKPLYGWEATGRVAHRALAALCPYLRIKRRQAENCLALRGAIEASKAERVRVGRGHQGSAPRSRRATGAMEECYARSRSLNRVGREVVP